MTVLQIIQPNNEILRKKAKRITNFKDKKLQTLIDDMIETMLDAPGVGLAAPQVAIGHRLIVVKLPDDEESQQEYGDDAGVLHIVLNPDIVKRSNTMVEGVEACLSIPGIFGTVDRHEQITIKGQDRDGKDIRIKANGWLARVFQHEIDHLDGVLFIDIANKLWRASEAPPEDEADTDESDKTSETDES